MQKKKLNKALSFNSLTINNCIRMKSITNYPQQNRYIIYNAGYNTILAKHNRSVILHFSQDKIPNITNKYDN